jgi:uncharacterized membrane protein
MHTVFLAVHIAAGATGLLVGPLAMRAPKARGRHTRLGTVYVVAVEGVAVSAVALAALHWQRLWWLALIGVATGAAAGAGLVVRPRQLHVSLMLGSYISLVTALLVVNFGTPAAWIVPTVVGSPLIAWTARRAAIRHSV